MLGSQAHCFDLMILISKKNVGPDVHASHAIADGLIIPGQMNHLAGQDGKVKKMI
jgi:hypothetical protein